MVFRGAQSTKHAVNIFKGDENEQLFRDVKTNSKVNTPFWFARMFTDNLLLAERLSSKLEFACKASLLGRIFTHL